MQAVTTCTMLLPIGSGLSANNCGQVDRNVVAQVLTTCVSRRACLLDTHASTVGYARQMHTHTVHVRYAHAHKHTHRIKRAVAIQAYNTRVEYRQVHNMPIHVHLAATSTSRLICWLARASLGGTMSLCCPCPSFFFNFGQD